jgi:hypothetical protein
LTIIFNLCTVIFIYFFDSAQIYFELVHYKQLRRTWSYPWRCVRWPLGNMTLWRIWNIRPDVFFNSKEKRNMASVKPHVTMTSPYFHLSSQRSKWTTTTKYLPYPKTKQIIFLSHRKILLKMHMNGKVFKMKNR